MAELPRIPNPRAAIEGLLLDELATTLDSTKGILAGNPEDSARRALERLGVQSEAETRIATELANRDVLAVPDRFTEAHRLVLHALDVLERDGARDPRIPPIGPLKPLARAGIELVAGYIVRNYAADVAKRLRVLYARREALADEGTPERAALTAAREEAESVAPGYSGGSLGVLGLAGGGIAGAAIAGIAPLVPQLANRAVLGGVLIALFVAFFCIGWAMLRGAAVARRRSGLIMGTPLAALWETIGHCGQPPTDNSVTIGTLAVVVTAITWVVLPVAIVAVYAG